MNGRILDVDDTVQNVQTLSAILKDAGYQVSVAMNGKQALSVLERIRPDLILLDVVMPEMNGWEACQKIKEVEALRDIPIIFLTSRSETEDIVQGFQLGAVDYVSKPFNAHELLARVNTHLTVDQLRQSLEEKNQALAVAHALVRSAFGRYVSEEVATSLLQRPEALELGGEERDVTILMSDLRGFTALAERLSPKEVLECLNVYLETMVDVIARYQGTVDEIIGDAILVIFGAPVRCDDHADLGVACAIAMQQAMVDINRQLVERGAGEVEMGIGVHTGRVIVGNIGSLRRTKYAAVGSNVNMAGRIESFTTGGQILVSEFTRAAVRSALAVVRSFEVEPKGARHKMELFEVRGIGAPYDLELPIHEVAAHPLDPPVAVHFTVLEEKFVGRTVIEGQLTAISEQGGTMVTQTPIAPLRNLKIELLAGTTPGGEIYAKVMEGPTDGRAGHLLRFTAVDPGLRAWLRELPVGAV